MNSLKSICPSILKLQKYEGCIFEGTVNSIFRSLMVEGMFKTFPKDTVVKHLLKCYNLCLGLENFEKDRFGGYIMKDNDVNHINIIVRRKEETDSVKAAMSMCGWFLACENKCEELAPTLIVSNPELKDCVVLQFEPLHQDTIGSFYKRFLQKDSKFLYHLTPTINLKKIKENGLCPKHKDKEFVYPDRIYLFGGKESNEEISYFANLLYCYEKNNEYKGEYSFLKIDLTKCGNELSLYKDPNMDGGLYTTDNIPPRAIEEYARITINNDTINKIKNEQL